MEALFLFIEVSSGLVFLFNCDTFLEGDTGWTLLPITSCCGSTHDTLGPVFQYLTQSLLEKAIKGEWLCDVLWFCFWFRIYV